MVAVAIDDRDPAVVYSAGWNQESVAQDFDETDTFTTLAGSKATLTFTGTSVVVFGTIPAKQLLPVSPASSYSIDGSNPVVFQPALGERQQFMQTFFKSPNLPDGTHTLVITNTITGVVPLILDGFVVQQSPADATATPSISTSATSASSSSSSSVSSSVTSSSTSTSSVSTSAPTSTSPVVVRTSVGPVTITVTTTTSSATDGISLASPKQTLDASNASSSSTKAGPIAGGVIGAIVLLFLLGLAFTFWRKRKQNREADMLFNSSSINLWRPPDSHNNNNNIDPFPITSQSPPPPRNFRSPSPTGPSPNMVQTAHDGSTTLAYDPQVQAPRFPGGYVPYGAANANSNGYNYGAVGTQPMYPQQQQQQQGYPNQAYLLPSQLMDQSRGDYGRGMPAPPSQDYANGSGARTRINLD